MNRCVYGKLLGFFLITIVFIAYRPAYPATGDEISEVKIIVDSDEFQVAVISHHYGAKYYSFNIEEIEYLYDEIRISDRMVISDEGIIIDGEKVPRDKLVSITIEKEEGALWHMRIKTGWKHLRSGIGNIKYAKTSYDSWKFFGNLIIDTMESIEGDAVVVFGDIEVYGKVAGDVVSIYGDIFLDSTAVVEGDVIAVTGDIITNEGAEIYGQPLPEAFFRGKEVNRFYLNKNKEGSFSLITGYNRVTGLDLGTRICFSDKKHEIPEVFAGGAYTFALKRWHYDFGFEQQFFDRFASIIGGGFYRYFDNSDRWIIEDEENSMAALLLKEDFHDFYEREGYSMHVEQWLGYNNRFRIDYRADSYDLLGKNTNWAFFGGKKDFRENYSFLLPDSTYIKGIKGEMKSVAFNYEFDSRVRHHPASGWHLFIEHEHAGYGLGGDFEFKRYWAEVQRLQPLTPRQYLNIRFIGGTSEDDIPLQKQYFLGGIGTLRGFDYKQFFGDRMVLVNVEYVVDLTEDIFGIAFYDIGKAAYGEDAFKDEDYHSDIGIAVEIGDCIRINFARPIDEPDSDIKVTVRAALPF